MAIKRLKGFWIKFSRLLLIIITVFLFVEQAHGKTWTRPAEGKGPTTVFMYIYVLDINQINSAEQTFSAHFYLEMSWMDPRLAHDGPDVRRYSADKLWHPDVNILNQLKIRKFIPYTVDVTKDGRVCYRQEIYGSFVQPFDLHDFPFDKHRFEMDFASFGHDDTEILFKTNPLIKSGFAQQLCLQGWQIVSWEMASGVCQPAPGSNPWPEYEFSFVAKRNSRYYIVQVIIPLLLILMMANVIFWIEPTQTGPQISVSTTAMLTMIAYRFAIGSDLPIVNYLTKMDIFIQGATVIVGLCLIEAIITSRLTEKKKMENAKAIDRKMRILFPAAVFTLAAYAFLIY